MNRFQCLLFVFSSTQFMASIYGRYKICDKSQNIVIDSALIEVSRKGDKLLTLFSGEEVYDFEPLEANKRPVVTGYKKLSDISTDLSPPISIAFFDWKIILYNAEKSKEWHLFRNRSFDSERPNDEWKRKAYFESIVFNAKNTFLSIKTINIGKIIALDSNKILVQSQVNGKDQIRMRDEKDQFEPKTVGFSELKGIAITSAFVSHNNVWYLMAGRMLCRMEIHSYKWMPLCQMEDISDWIDCGSDWNPIYAILLAFIAFTLILILLAIIVWFCRNKKNAKTEAKTESIAPKPKTESIAPKPKTESIAPKSKTESIAPKPKTESIAPKSESIAPKPKTESIATKPESESIGSKALGLGPKTEKSSQNTGSFQPETKFSSAFRAKVQTKK